MDLQAYIRAIRKNWVYIAVACVIGAALGWGLSVTSTKVYSGSVTFYVSTPSLSQAATPLSTDQYAQARATSYGKLLSSDALARAVVANSNLGLSASDVASKIAGSAELNTVFVVATVRDTSPQRALAILQGVAKDFPILANSLDNTAAQDNIRLTVTSGPSVSSTPVSPRPKLDIAIGVLGGILLGLVIAVLRDLLDTSVRSLEGLQEVSGMPVLGTIPFDATARTAPLVVGEVGHTVRAEAYRQLRTSLQFLDIAHAARVIVVTSAKAGEGKTSTSVNLALVLSETGKDVLLIEADLRRPRAAEYLGVERSVGLTNVLAGQVSFDDAVQQWGDKTLSILPSGSIPPNPAELLGIREMQTLITNARKRFDFIIVDTPPLLPVTDAAVATGFADGVVLVVRHGGPSKPQLAAAVRNLNAVGARSLGTVFNFRPTRGAEAQGQYEAYEYDRDDLDMLPSMLAATAGGAKSRPRQRARQNERRVTSRAGGYRGN